MAKSWVAGSVVTVLKVLNQVLFTDLCEKLTRFTADI